MRCAVSFERNGKWRLASECRAETARRVRAAFTYLQGHGITPTKGNAQGSTDSFACAAIRSQGGSAERQENRRFVQIAQSCKSATSIFFRPVRTPQRFFAGLRSHRYRLMAASAASGARPLTLPSQAMQPPPALQSGPAKTAMGAVIQQWRKRCSLLS